ncbi:aspartate/glutamate racemase family protein [Zavarzinia sp. CC-PAN008]|uniref:aspartate/glutamate racemase family protein n=1 Tax=Zavarzinia sp. CC-PAN008 TaxID=3243332 RepID=UPI003F747C83
MRILVVNPNTTARMTDGIARAARAVAAPGTEIVAVTNRAGPVSIEGFYDEAFAVPGMLAELAAADGIDGAVIACFDDTGLDAARALLDVPAVGLCEAALTAAGLIGSRISVVTTLARSIVPIEGLVRRYGFAERARVHASDIPVLALDDPQSGASAQLEAAVGQALAQDRSDVVVLGCAGMAELTARLSQRFGVPVVDGVAVGVKLVEALVGLNLRTSKAGPYARPLAKPYLGPFKDQAPR